MPKPPKSAPAPTKYLVFNWPALERRGEYLDEGEAARAAKQEGAGGHVVALEGSGLATLTRWHPGTSEKQVEAIKLKLHRREHPAQTPAAAPLIPGTDAMRAALPDGVELGPPRVRSKRAAPAPRPAPAAALRQVEETAALRQVEETAAPEAPAEPEKDTAAERWVERLEALRRGYETQSALATALGCAAPTLSTALHRGSVGPRLQGLIVALEGRVPVAPVEPPAEAPAAPETRESPRARALATVAHRHHLDILVQQVEQKAAGDTYSLHIVRGEDGVHANLRIGTNPSIATQEAARSPQEVLGVLGKMLWDLDGAQLEQIDKELAVLQARRAEVERRRLDLL